MLRLDSINLRMQTTRFVQYFFLTIMFLALEKSFLNDVDSSFSRVGYIFICKRRTIEHRIQ